MFLILHVVEASPADVEAVRELLCLVPLQGLLLIELMPGVDVHAEQVGPCVCAAVGVYHVARVGPLARGESMAESRVGGLFACGRVGRAAEAPLVWVVQLSALGNVLFSTEVVVHLVLVQHIGTLPHSARFLQQSTEARFTMYISRKFPLIRMWLVSSS